MIYIPTYLRLVVSDQFAASIFLFSEYFHSHAQILMILVLVEKAQNSV